MKPIEDQIREKKTEIKEANRALSKLQDELKKKNELSIPQVISIDRYDKQTIEYRVWFKANHPIEMEKIQSAIESLSDKPSEPKSYVDWNKIDKKYNWCTLYELDPTPSCGFQFWKHKPCKKEDEYDSSLETYANLHEAGGDESSMIGPYPAWDKSLIHRPGAKE